MSSVLRDSKTGKASGGRSDGVRRLSRDAGEAAHRQDRHGARRRNGGDREYRVERRGKNDNGRTWNAVHALRRHQRHPQDAEQAQGLRETGNLGRSPHYVSSPLSIFPHAGKHFIAVKIDNCSDWYDQLPENEY